jgi:desampylase
MWVMKLQISRTRRQQLLDWAEVAEPQECCGLLLGNNGVVDHILLTANVARNPDQEFEIDPIALIAAEKTERQGGPAILGYFHSHPNGAVEPSPKDAYMADADGRIWLIIAKGRITAWQTESDGAGGAVSFVPEAIVWG